MHVFLNYGTLNFLSVDFVINSVISIGKYCAGHANHNA